MSLTETRMPNAGYTETDTVNPISAYGKTKLAGEENIRKNTDKHFIIRTAWLFGAVAPPSSNKNFVLKIIDRAGKLQKLRVVNDQIGTRAIRWMSLKPYGK